MSQSPKQSIVLYHERSSSCSWRVRIGLAWKELEYESRLLEWGSGELQSEAHRRRSPFGQVPCLEIEGRLVSQSVAILELLEELHPEPALLPDAALDRARVRELVEAVNAGIQPLHNGGLRAPMRERFGADDEALESWSRYWTERRLGELEPVVERRKGRFACGDRVSLADVLLYPQLCKAMDFGVPLDAFPTLSALHAELARLPAFSGTALQTPRGRRP